MMAVENQLKTQIKEFQVKLKENEQQTASKSEIEKGSPASSEKTR